MANTGSFAELFQKRKGFVFWFSVVRREGAYYDSPLMLVTGHGSKCLEPYSPKGLRAKKRRKSIVSRVSAIGFLRKLVIPRLSAFLKN